MTSTNTFQGMDTNAKPSSRVLRPPGGGSSNLFGGSDNESGSPVNRSNKMASSIFAPHEESQGSPRKTNPPGGKSSGIFAESEAPASKGAEPHSGATSNIFVDAPTKPQTFRHYPLKPKDNIGINAIPSSEAPLMKEPAASRQEAGAGPKERADSPCHQGEDPHEPRLGPIPRSHNKVIQPPGGKSSVVFY